jgi:hypothetical protein
MSSLFDSYEKEFKRNLVPVTLVPCCSRVVLAYDPMQLFMNERVDKLNSLTGSGLAACLQEAEESVLPCRPTPALFHSITSFDQMRTCGDMLEKMDFEVDGGIDSRCCLAPPHTFFCRREI